MQCSEWSRGATGRPVIVVKSDYTSSSGHQLSMLSLEGRDAVICPACGQDVPRGRFCSACGEHLQGLQAPYEAEPAPATFLRRSPESTGPGDTPVETGGTNGIHEVRMAHRKRLSGRTLIAATIGAAVLVTALVLVAHFLSNGSPAHSISGNLTVKDFGGAGGCGGGYNATEQMDRLNKAMDGETFLCPQGPGGGYADLRDGTTVVAHDGGGKVVATGQLAGGVFTSAGVSFTFELVDVPDSDFYAFEVSHRGQLTQSRAELEASGWTVVASIG